jgi:O-6-methylguanine DNA methyltransferase
MHTARIETSAGCFTAKFSEAGLAELSFPSERKPGAVTGVGKPDHNEPVGEVLPAIRRWLAITEKALNGALAGKSPRALPPFDLSCGTDFQQQVWRVLAEIPTGRTLTYAEVAARVGNPKAARAVGGACGANPIPVLIPCHRVLAAHSRIGGFSAGLDWKRRLLTIEGVLLA